MESFIKLTVKTPNQHIDDVQIDCDLEWTVRRLKEYLQDVYPSNPESSTQKLIYLGKLLQDHVSLKEVFGELGARTLHIVCSENHCRPDSTAKTVTEKGTTATVVESTVTATTPLADSTDGLRYRGLTSQQNVSTPTTPTFSSAQLPGMITSSSSNMAQWYQSQYHQHMQAQWPQPHQYQMQMHQYFQQWQQWQNAMACGQWPYNQMPYRMSNIFPSPPSPAMTPVTPDTPAPPQEAAAVPQPPPQMVDPQNQNIRMNAGPGGAIMQDEDEENENPRNGDWLDWLYMSMRALVLFSIIYFYSSTSRFLLVGILGFILYLYQAGWFTPRRVEIQADPVEEVENTQPADEPSHNNEDNNEHEDEENNTINDTDSQQQQPPRPNVFRILCTFVISFVTSLVPAAPPALQQQ